MVKLNACIFYLKMKTCLKNIILFGIKSAKYLKKIDTRPIYNKRFFKVKIKSYCDKATDYHDEEIPKVGSIILV